MTEQFCNALLRTTALQILQSAGFDSAHTEPTNLLTDVMSQYIKLLGRTTSVYAELTGRSTGNIWDALDGLQELGITPESLKEWLELEGKALNPSWTPQSDPSRILEELVKDGRHNYDDALVYEYKEIPSDDDDVYSLESEEEEEELEVEEKEKEEKLIPKDNNKKVEDEEEENNGLPDYIPPYMPRFPSSIKEDATPPPRALPQVMPSITRQTSPGSTAVPAPIIVRHRKKPVDNPFTHVVPFEESALATDKTTTLALSLHENEENTNESSQQNQGQQTQQQQQQPASKRRRVALSNLPMKKVMTSLASKDQQQRRKQREALAGNHEMFRKFTQDEAAPGNTMFGNTNGVLEELLRRVAPPAMVSKLSSPNLLVDVATAPTPATPANPTSNGTVSSQQDPITVKTASSSNSRDSASNRPSSSNSTSMLASLAGGQYNRKHPLEEITTASSPNSNNTSSTTNLLSSSQTATSPAATATTANNTLTTSTSRPTSPTQRANLTPISLASLSAAGTGKASSGKGSSGKAGSEKSSSGKSSSGKVSSGKSASGKGGSDKKKLPKLTLNLSNGNGNGDATIQSATENTPSSANSVNTPKIRFKIKPPEPANEKIDITSTDDSPPPSSISALSESMALSAATPPPPTSQQAFAQSAIAPPPSVDEPLQEGETPEIVRCICSNPTIDYGTFMISCDKCHVWYHGECVGVTESDKIETWYCSNCSA
ncbi:hypothetical protein BDA99DRAFT_526491 [Phascolomyces articulosus]|uniref:PHD-type domain-containing protein n=1 Tax=Phascolomyces articulosus TaxID=60185 RepID=A0AAD5P8C5_9FUNG|nr:hypothetical protein BDA99DRAFT_526491 [Phascolomyces articulosus]